MEDVACVVECVAVGNSIRWNEYKNKKIRKIKNELLGSMPGDYLVFL